MAKNFETFEKGNLGVAKVVVDLIKQGFDVFSPLNPHSVIDLIAYKNEKTLRIQVKYVKKNKYDIIMASHKRSCISARHMSSHYSPEDLDVLTVYCPETDECYYVPMHEIKKSVTLRFTQPKNKQKNVRYAEDYKLLNSGTPGWI